MWRWVGLRRFRSWVVGGDGRGQDTRLQMRPALKGCIYIRCPRTIRGPTGLYDRREDMSEAYTGGCACGAIRYEISAEPMVTNDCQCRDCQRESGTGHGSHLTFPRAGVKLKGEAKHWDMVGDSGN